MHAWTSAVTFTASFPIEPSEITMSGPQLETSKNTRSISRLSLLHVDTEDVNTARCTAGRCSHTFEPPSNPPSSYDSVSVAAENVVGVGATRTCTAQTISELLGPHGIYRKDSYILK